MGILDRYNPKDRLYLSVVETGEEIPKNKIEILFCDSKGHLTTSIIESRIYEHVFNSVADIGKLGKGAVAISLEITEGQSVSFAFEINEEQAEAMNKMLNLASDKRHALNGGDVLPPDLAKRAKEIIRLGKKMLPIAREMGIVFM